MKTKQFGLLIRALRETMLNDDLRPLTREGLSDAIYEQCSYLLTADAIGKIERGERSRFELDELFALADAFGLTSAERERFLLASTGVTDEQICRESAEPEYILENLIAYMSELRLPWTLMDQYCDFIYASPSITRLFHLEESHFASLQSNPLGFNLFNLMLSAQLPYQSTLFGSGRSDLFDEYMFASLFFFRKNTFLSRTTPYYKFMFKELRKLRHFRTYWEDLPFQARDYNGTGLPYEYEDPEFGPLRYITLQNPLLTKAGMLTSLTYAPLDAHTSAVFDQILAETGPGAIPFSSWPEKHVPTRTRTR